MMSGLIDLPPSPPPSKYCSNLTSLYSSIASRRNCSLWHLSSLLHLSKIVQAKVSMALDADRNLAAEKEESFIKWLQKGLESKKAQTPNTKKIHQQFETSYLPSIPSKTERSCSNDAAVHLPQEIILQILSYIPRDPTSQSYLHACSLVSRSWYSATVPLLYHSPHFTGKNFRQFVATVCPSINAHIRKSELAGLVRRLDMGNLVHDGSKSLTARLLGRVKGGLEEFVAPQASFA